MTTENSSSPDFIRRKFTLPKALDVRLQDLAAQHYSGNVSLCIRAALADHETTLTDNKSRSLHRVEQQIKSLEADIQPLVDISNNPTDRNDTCGGQHEFSNLGLGNEQGATTNRVYTEFEGGRLSLRIADLVDRLDDSPESIVRACEQLLDFGYIVETDQPQRYRRPTLGETP